MSQESIESVRTRILRAVVEICIVEVDRLKIDNYYYYETAGLESIPGVPDHLIEIQDVTFTYNGKLANGLAKHFKNGDLPQMQLLSAFLLADGMGINASPAVKRREYRKPFCREVAEKIIAAADHDHEICEKSMMTHWPL